MVPCLSPDSANFLRCSPFITILLRVDVRRWKFQWEGLLLGSSTPIDRTQLPVGVGVEAGFRTQVEIELLAQISLPVQFS